MALVAACLVAAALLACTRRGPGAPDDASSGVRQGRTLDQVGDRLTVVARDLEAPWSLAFLPEGDLLVAERPGRLVRLSPDGTRRWSVTVPGVRARGEGGLLGMALHPGFTRTRWIFLYLTSTDENRVERYTLGDDGTLGERTVLVDGIPAASIHDGGRIAFGPDALLYVTTGDAGRADGARDPAYLGGKILRMTDEGAAADNPLAGFVYSLGHRNPEGLTWADDGTLWETEHGPSGFPGGFDELNRIVPRGDYGWPDVLGSETLAGTIGPVLHSGPDDTWAPAGAAWWRGRVFFTGLRGQALYEAEPAGAGATLTAHLKGDLGRLRGGWIGPDGKLWFFTSNRDGRGRPNEGDDQLLRLDPAALVEGR